MKISIITVCFNNASTLRDTMRSVLGQTHPDMEYIVVDGASTDGTVSILREMEPLFRSRMKWVSEPDEGIYDAMNKGILMATGDVVGFLNGDDYYQDNRVLEDIARAFSENGTDAVHGNLSYINSERKVVRTWQAPPTAPERFREAGIRPTPPFTAPGNALSATACLIPPSAAAADFELMLRFVEKHHISTHYLDRFMVFMRTGGSSTAGLKAVRRNTRQNKQAFRKNRIPCPWHYGISRLASKILSVKHPFLYLAKSLKKS